MQLNLLESASPETVLAELTEQLRAMAAAESAASEEPDTDRFVRVEIPVSACCPIAWLRQQTASTKLYWRDRQGSRAVAGIGALDLIRDADDHNHSAVVDDVRARLATAPEAVRYFGGIAFAPHPRQRADSWSAFGRARFVLPRCELIRNDDGNCVFAWNGRATELRRNDQACHKLHREIDAIRFGPPEDADPLPIVNARTDSPAPRRWNANVNHVLEQLGVNGLSKVVLARQRIFEFAHAVDPFTILDRAQSQSPNCFHFYFQPRPGHAFFSVSPERLYRRDGTRLFLEAVAGTRHRGASAATDANLGTELFGSDKENREHSIVAENLTAALLRLNGRIVTHHPVSLLKLNRIQHLYQPIEAVIRSDTTDSVLLAVLHPTAAVGGDPTTTALKVIAEREDFDRGWYAGPVGWISRHQAEFAVAIRSGLIAGHRLNLFAGAGIVQGSDPAAEWDETEKKLNSVIDLSCLR